MFEVSLVALLCSSPAKKYKSSWNKAFAKSSWLNQLGFSLQLVLLNVSKARNGSCCLVCASVLLKEKTCCSNKNVCKFCRFQQDYQLFSKHDLVGTKSLTFVKALVILKSFPFHSVIAEVFKLLAS